MTQAETTAIDRNRRIRRLTLAASVAIVVLVAVSGWWLRKSAEFETADGDARTSIYAAEQRLLLESLKQRPDHHGIRYRLAETFKETEPLVALKLFRQIPAEAKEYLPARRHMAYLCLTSRLDREAEHILLSLAGADPNDHAVHLALAELYFRRKEYRKALSHAERCSDLEPGRVQTYILIGDIHNQLDQIAEMIAPLQRALKLQPDLYVAHVNVAYAFLRTGELERARQETQWCLDRRKDDRYTLWLRASVARDQGHLEEAERALQAALQLAPDDLTCRLLESDLLISRSESEKAYTRLKSLQKQSNDKLLYLEALARAAAATGRQEEARRLEHAIQRHKQRHRRPAK